MKSNEMLQNASLYNTNHITLINMMLENDYYEGTIEFAIKYYNDDYE